MLFTLFDTLTLNLVEKLKGIAFRLQIYLEQKLGFRIAAYT